MQKEFPAISPCTPPPVYALRVQPKPIIKLYEPRAYNRNFSANQTLIEVQPRNHSLGAILAGNATSK